MRGSGRLRLRFLLSMATVVVAPARAQQDPGGGIVPPLVPYRVENDYIAASLTGDRGDPVWGAALFASRQTSTCLLCHADPSVRKPLTGTIGSSLADVGSRLTAGQIRLRIVDAARINQDTVMPSFYTTAGLHRVGHQWQGKPILDAAQIEDLVAFLVTLRSQ